MTKSTLSIIRSLISALLILTLVSTPSARAWDPVRDLTGRTVKQHAERRLDRIKQSAKKIAHNPVKYTLQLPIKLLSEACSAPVRAWESSMLAQAKGKWRTLPDGLVSALQQHYPGANLDAVRYVEKIKTGSNNAVTIGNRIFFPRDIDFNTPTDMRWMLHELEHVGQFANSYTSTQLCEYVLKAIGSGFKHDNIDMERAADRKADYLLRFALEVSNSLPPEPPQIQKNQISVVNLTDVEVYFSLETASYGEENLSVWGNHWRIFTGAAKDEWFNITITTDGVTNSYGVRGGRNYLVQPDARGILIVYELEEQ